MRKNTKRGKNFLDVKNTYLVQGLNLDRLLLVAKNKGITLYNIKKITNKRMIVSLSIKESQNFFAITKELCYNIKKVKENGKALPLLMLWRRVGIVVGAIIFSVACYVYNDFIYGFSFSGSGSAIEKEVLSYLNGAGIKKFSRFSDIDISRLEDQILAHSPNLSFVGITKKGNVLCFDLALAENNTDILKGNVYALNSEVSGTVEKIKVYRGTAVVSQGDYVNSGELLVEGYMTIKDQKVKINVIASVTIIASKQFTFTDSESGKEQQAMLIAKAMSEGLDVVSSEVTCTKEKDVFVYITTINYRHITYVG